MKSHVAHRWKRKLLEESQAKILLDSIDVKQGVGVKKSTQIINNLDSSMLFISNPKLIRHLCI